MSSAIRARTVLVVLLVFLMSCFCVFERRQIFFSSLGFERLGKFSCAGGGGSGGIVGVDVFWFLLCRRFDSLIC